MDKNACKKFLTALIFLGFLVYGLAFIYRTSFIVQGKRYFCLFDDAMISMTYARNLAQGNGLVWHPDGEKVEGCTNLLWVIYMSLFHLLPIAESKISVFIQLSGLFLLALNLLFVKKIGDLIGGKSGPITLGAMLLTAFYLPLNTWSLQGMEVSALTLLVTASVWAAMRSMEKEKAPTLPFLLLGLGTLIRLDMVVPYIGILIYRLFCRLENKTRILKRGMIILFMFLASQTLFRMVYYGDMLPNPYYLKMAGIPLKWRLLKGMIVLCLFLWKLNWVLFLVPFLMILIYKNKKSLLPAFLILLQLGYSVYVGGDSWEWWGGANRFISIVMPLFFILFSWSLGELISMLRARGEAWLFQNPRMSSCLHILLLFGALVNFNAIRGPAALKEWLLLERPLHVSDHREKVEEALLLRKITKPEARVAVAWGGIPIYFSQRRGVDLLGKNDRKIAREPMRKIDSFRQFTPGHLKRDYAYSIGELKPHAVAELTREPNEAKPYLDESYRDFHTDKFHIFLLINSPNINWEEVKRLEKNP